MFIIKLSLKAEHGIDLPPPMDTGEHARPAVHLPPGLAGLWPQEVFGRDVSSQSWGITARSSPARGCPSNVAPVNQSIPLLPAWTSAPSGSRTKGISPICTFIKHFIYLSICLLYTQAAVWMGSWTQTQAKIGARDRNNPGNVPPLLWDNSCHRDTK